MSTSTHEEDLQRWLAATVEAADEVALDALEIGPCTVIAHGSALPDPAPGAVIALSAAGEAFRIGILAAPAGCEQIARALLRIGPTEDPLSERETEDAMRETVNILAGAVKRRLVDDGVAREIGIPRSVLGRGALGDGHGIAVAAVKLGPVRADILTVASDDAPSE